MSFSFIHTADWQIGKPFRGFEPRVSGVLEEARLDAIDRLAEVARAAGSRHVLVAGDVFDAETLPRRTLWQPVQRMQRAVDLTWWLLPGNHDPARPGGAWQRLMRWGLPDNVRAIVEPAVIEVEAGVHVLAAPLVAKGQSRDPTAWFDGAATPAGALRIGLAHGSIRDFGESGESAVRIDAARAKSAGLAYLALGDWHGLVRVNERTWYSGTPEPDRFVANNPGHALVVNFDGATTRAEPVKTARFAWCDHKARIGPDSPLHALERTLLTLAPSPDRLLLRLALEGHMPLAARAGVAQWCERMQASLRHFEADLTGLRASLEGNELAELDRDSRLRATSQRLRAMIEDPSDARQAVAERALDRLYEITAALEAEPAG